MAQQLNGKTVAILATDGFEQAELDAPKAALEKAGADVDVIAPQAGEIQGLKHMEKGSKVRVDHTLDDVSAKDYDAIVLPGGVLPKTVVVAPELGLLRPVVKPSSFKILRCASTILTSSMTCCWPASSTS